MHTSAEPTLPASVTINEELMQLASGAPKEEDGGCLLLRSRI